MRYLLKLAARNLWRQKRRTVLTALAVAVGLAGLIVVDSLLAGVDRDAIKNLVDLSTGELVVHAPGYTTAEEALSIERTLDARAALEAALSAPGVRSAAPRVAFSARLNTGIEDIPVVGMAIDPQADRQVFTLPEFVEGRLPAAGADEAAIGRDLASSLELGMGDVFTLVMRTRDGAFQALDLTIVGLIRSPHPDVNKHHVYLPLDVAWRALALDGQATEVVIRLERGAGGAAINEAARAVADAMSARGVDAEVLTWREAARDFLTITQTKQGFTALFIFMIMVIAVVGVVNTILLGAMERAREIGMMQAMGMRSNEIVLLFMAEAAGVGVLGSVLGCLMGVAGEAYLVLRGIDVLSAYGDLDVGYPLAGVLRGAWNLPMIAWAFVLGVAVCLVASYVPARRAASRAPILSLRHE